MNDLVLVQVFLGGFVLYSCFCQMVFTTKKTDWMLRWALLFKSACAFLVMGAPLLPLIHPSRTYWPAWSTPEWVWVLFLVAATLVHLSWARHWPKIAGTLTRSRPPCSL